MKSHRLVGCLGGCSCFSDPSEGSLFEFGSNNGQRADLLSINPSDDFKNTLLVWITAYCKNLRYKELWFF